ncbi:MAG: acyl-protein synthetase [bacterium]|nr:acyl-protein synthetase [bacterium]
MELPQFSIPQAEKEVMLLEELERLSIHHRRGCEAYARIAAARRWQEKKITSLREVPYFPVGLFKSHRLVSVPDEEIVTELASSGTSGQAVSRIFLDRETSILQSKALARIMGQIVGQQRLPMIIVDSEALLRDRSRFSARAVGVLGMMRLGVDHFFALDPEMRLDEKGLHSFLDRHKGEALLAFGFTFMVWRYFYSSVSKLGLDLGSATLFHSGGWKKLGQESVTNNEFKRRLHEATGLSRIYSFYGMVEQVGSVFVEGEDGFLYAPNFADVIVRNPETWEEAQLGEEGVLQVLSVLPRSYPGHSLLTEDLGVVHGVDDSDCGRMGKRFEVMGRVPRTELRGCSDVYAYGSEVSP